LQAFSCTGCPNQTLCASGEIRRPDSDLLAVTDRLKNVRHKILILSGKGGVGKSAVAANLARALAVNDKIQVGLLDIDICGPSQARMLGVEQESVHESGDGWCPIVVKDNLIVMSIAFLLQNRSEAVIWRGARKNALIKQFLKVNFLFMSSSKNYSLWCSITTQFRFRKLQFRKKSIQHRREMCTLGLHI
uniref:Cytosolic Fe-S cluster assembly factor NUBP1 homolog n=1 Tax=Brugia timori TaxID=42155 RepID=A0A0R3QGN6_9BILA